MTETKWLTTTNATSLLKFARSQFNDRKLRLMLVACSRLVWDEILLKEPIEIAEEYADGLISDEVLRGAMSRVYMALCEPIDTSEHQKWYDPYSMKRMMFFSSAPAFQNLGSMHIERTSAWNVVSKELGDRALPVLRCAFGNPFRKVVINPAWMAETVIAMTKAMYESRDFSPMPILADALEDAGCEDEAILRHCRDEGPHARGCWVVDALVGSARESTVSPTRLAEVSSHS